MSAKSYTVDFMVSGKSLMWHRKSKGPYTVQLLLTFHPPGLPSSCGLSRSLLSMCGQDLGHCSDPACIGPCCRGPCRRPC